MACAPAAASLRGTRIACLAFFCVANAVYALAGAGATHGAEGVDTEDYLLGLSKVLVLLLLIPLVSAGPARLAEAAVLVAVAMSVFGINLHATEVAAMGAGTACYMDELGHIIIFAAMPLICGVAFMPDWRLYAVVCAVHAARSIVQISPLGAVPTAIVCIGSAFGGLFTYLMERNYREHFVRAAACRLGCCECCGLMVACH
jgi:hypothetical protein